MQYNVFGLYYFILLLCCCSQLILNIVFVIYTNLMIVIMIIIIIIILRGGVDLDEEQCNQNKGNDSFGNNRGTLSAVSLNIVDSIRSSIDGLR